jgi:hypothetical protein
MTEKPNRKKNDDMRTTETRKTREARDSVLGQDGQTSITIGQGDISEYLVIEIKFMMDGDDICYIGYHESISDEELEMLFDEELETMFDEVVEHVTTGRDESTVLRIYDVFSKAVEHWCGGE